MLAAELLAEGGVVHLPGGGTHHGLPDRANGFCYLNDPVFAILSFRNMGLKRILYVDLDAHHCDGVELAFAGATDVRMISVHEASRWPFTGAFEDSAGGAALNLPVPAGLNDSEFKMICDEVIRPAAEDFRLARSAPAWQCRSPSECFLFRHFSSPNLLRDCAASAVTMRSAMIAMNATDNPAMMP